MSSKASEYQRAYLDRLRADPAAWAAFLEKKRASQRAYNKSTKGRAAMARHVEKVELSGARVKSYRKSRKGKGTAAKYHAAQKARDPEGYQRKAREARARYLAKAGNREKARAHERAVYADKRGSMRPVLSSCALARRDAVYGAIWAALPPKLPPSVRDDVASEAVILLLSGEAASPAEAVRKGITAHYRVFSTFEPTISLDYVEPGDRSLHERLSVGLW